MFSGCSGFQATLDQAAGTTQEDGGMHSSTQARITPPGDSTSPDLPGGLGTRQRQSRALAQQVFVGHITLCSTYRVSFAPYNNSAGMRCPECCAQRGPPAHDSCSPPAVPGSRTCISCSTRSLPL